MQHGRLGGDLLAISFRERSPWVVPNVDDGQARRRFVNEEVDVVQVRVQVVQFRHQCFQRNRALCLVLVLEKFPALVGVKRLVRYLCEQKQAPVGDGIPRLLAWILLRVRMWILS